MMTSTLSYGAGSSNPLSPNRLACLIPISLGLRAPLGAPHSLSVTTAKMTLMRWSQCVALAALTKLRLLRLTRKRLDPVGASRTLIYNLNSKYSFVTVALLGEFVGS